MKKATQIFSAMVLSILLLGGCGSTNETPSGNDQASVGQLFNNEGVTGALSQEQMEMLQNYDCPQIDRPVCDSEGQTHLNACEAAKTGATQWTSGACV